MEAEITSKVKKVFERKISKVAIIGFIAIILLGAVFLVYMLKFRSSAAQTLQLRTSKVTRGNISISITGSGPIQSSNSVDISSKINGSVGTITKVYFKEGDSVKKGDLMFELDDSDAKLSVEKIKNSIEQALLSQSTNTNSLGKLSLAAPISGQVTNIMVKAGDIVNKNAPVLTITDHSKLKMTVPFNAASMGIIKVGQSATVNLQGLMQSVEGKVSYVYNNSYSTASGGQIFNVEITVDNPGSISEGAKANAEINTLNGTQPSTDNGTLSYTNSQVVKSDSGGTVKNVYAKENQNVNAGDLLAEFQNDDLAMTVQTSELKIKDLQAQLAEAEKQLGYYKVTSSIDGVIVKQDVNVGDNVKSGDVISTVSDSGHMEFEVSVDELDIAKMQTGQNVDVTLDALTETSSSPIKGTVSKIALQGTSSNGVTTYPVTIQIEENDKLKVGMNANAEIFISQKLDVLTVPIEAVTKMRNRAFVWVKTDEKTAAQAKNAQQGNWQGGRNGQNGQSSQSGQGNQNSQNSKNGQGNQNGQGNWQGSQGDQNAQSNQSGQSGQSVQSGQNSKNSQSNQGSQSGQNSQRSQNSQNGQRSQNTQRNSQFSEYYKNAMMKQVEIGTNNDTTIEIVSGLNEGDEVVLPPLSQSSSTTTTNKNSSPFGGGMPGMGGFGGNGGQRQQSGSNNKSSGGFNRD